MSRRTENKVIAPRSRLEVRFTRLLDGRGLVRPDGRALYSYRFTREEYKMIREDLRSSHLFWLKIHLGERFSLPSCRNGFVAIGKADTGIGSDL